MAKKLSNETLPTQSQIHDAVVAIIASFAKRDPTTIKDTDELVKDLGIPDSSMPFLALALRGYIKHFRPDRSIGVSEIRKPKQTVGGVVTIVQDRILS